MGTSRSFVSSFAELKDDFRNDHMKICFLWHDEVMLDISNDYRRNNYATQISGNETLTKEQTSLLTDIFIPLQDRVSSDLLEAYNESRPTGYPRWGKDYENFTYSEPKNSEQYAHNILLAHIKLDWKLDEFSGGDVEHAEGRARAAINTVGLWECIQQEAQCMLEASYDERVAMSAARIFNSSPQNQVEPFSLFEASIPSLSSVPWTEIINIKKSGRFEKLRSKLSEIANTPNIDKYTAQAELTQLEDHAAEDIIERYRPKLKKVAIESILANIPGIPGINPFGVFFGIRDTYKEAKKRKDLSWFYTLRDVRKLAKDF
ncbi:hypothetical protein [Pseudomonas sp.]|uniref:hypothetical protein n=1 Tax=Pseudomonas sp. TaxID=306 RepID=UPI003266D528